MEVERVESGVAPPETIRRPDEPEPSPEPSRPSRPSEPPPPPQPEYIAQNVDLFA